MQIVRHPKFCPKEARGAAIALGNFDGLHAGHKAVLKHTQALAKAANIPSAIFTFEPHPVSVLRPENTAFRLTPFREKMKRLKKLGIDYVFMQRFSKAFSQTTAESFVKDILVAQLGIHTAVTGQDFIFGHNREGNAAYLEKMSQTLGFAYERVAPQEDSTARFSSTRTRALIKEGKLEEAATLLGAPYAIEGRVCRGAQRGRTIGFPTANLRLKEYIHPPYGVYKVRVDIEGGEKALPAIANIGVKPTFNGKEPLIEIHIFDFDKNIYGARLRVTLETFIRPEHAFENVDALIQQITQDCEMVKEQI
jgi:riboflavin kinase/FMN adenylyltransferase